MDVQGGPVSKEHVHDFNEYVLVIEGRCTALLEGQSIELVAGQELHIPKGTLSLPSLADRKR